MCETKGGSVFGLKTLLEIYVETKLFLQNRNKSSSFWGGGEKTQPPFWIIEKDDKRLLKGRAPPFISMVEMNGMKLYVKCLHNLFVLSPHSFIVFNFASFNFLHRFHKRIWLWTCNVTAPLLYTIMIMRACCAEFSEPDGGFRCWNVNKRQHTHAL